jgi:hypothetical protein
MANSEEDTMKKSKILILAWVICLWVCGIVFAQPYWKPDLNGDGFVDFGDFGRLAENWKQSGSDLYQRP